MRTISRAMSNPIITHTDHGPLVIHTDGHRAEHLQANLDLPGPCQAKSGKELSRLLALLDSLETESERRGEPR